VFRLSTLHLVCVTKYRRKIFDSDALAWLQGHARRLFQRMDCQLLACDGEADHLHMLVEYPPKLSVSVMVNAFKGTSSRLLHQERPHIAARYRKGVLWSPSYFAASTGGATLETVKRYVEQHRAEAAGAPTPPAKGGACRA
jgi:putative transposase